MKYRLVLCCCLLAVSACARTAPSASSVPSTPASPGSAYSQARVTDAPPPPEPPSAAIKGPPLQPTLYEARMALYQASAAHPPSGVDDATLRKRAAAADVFGCSPESNSVVCNVRIGTRDVPVRFAWNGKAWQAAPR